MLYHYTSIEKYSSIYDEGYIRPFKSHSPVPYVWLTSEADFFGAAYKHGLPYERTQLRIAFNLDDRFTPWLDCVMDNPTGAHELTFHQRYSGWTEQWISKGPIDILTAVEIVFRPDVAQYIEYCNSAAHNRQTQYRNGSRT